MTWQFLQMPPPAASHPPKYKSPSPGWARVEPPVDTSSAYRAVYSGSGDRIGSFGPHFGGWLACNRHGTPLGPYNSPAEAIAALIAAAVGARSSTGSLSRSGCTRPRSRSLSSQRHHC